MARKRGRAQGEGTIFRRGDGRWVGEVSLGRDIAGTRKKKTVYGHTQAEVVKKIATIKRKLTAGSLSSEDPTLAEYLERWLQEKQREVKTRTIASYRGVVKNHLVPRLGRLRLSQLTPLRIQAALGEVHDAVSAHTSNYARSVLTMALNQAVRWQIMQTNPVTGVTRSRQEPREMTLWSASEVTAFLAAAERHRLYALFYLAITSGLRIGELLALRWADLKGHSLHVKGTLGKTDGAPAIATTKTAKGHRRVPLAQDTLDVLSTHLTRQNADRTHLGVDAWRQPEQMFVSEIGTYLDVDNVRRTWKRIQREAAVPPARLHDTRHLNVSLLIKQGMDAATIADRIGHSNPAFTMRKYAHLFDEQREAAALTLRQLLGPMPAPKGRLQRQPED